MKAEYQLTTEQLLLEAYEHQAAPANKTQVNITDTEELHEQQRRTRQGYEDALRRNRLDLGQWIRYAQYEVDNHDYHRARSIFERSLEINAQHVPTWIRYIDVELKGRNINHARNLFDRVTTLLPRVDKFWYRYVQTEETLQNVITTRDIFQRWMRWEPDMGAWDAYINFEKRYHAYDNIRAIYNQYVRIHKDAWSKWVKFEQSYGNSSTIREVFSVAIDTLQSEEMITKFAQYEATQGEFERCRAIFQFGLKHFPSSKVIQTALTQFEKSYGDTSGIESSILQKRKQKYLEEVKKDPNDYDTWWLYLSLLSSEPIETQIEGFETAVKNLPQSRQKSDWKRYIYIWIKYSLTLELSGKVEESREVYQRATSLTKTFTFSKLWILYAQFELRHANLPQARKILGQSIGRFPKRKTFRYYISLEIKLKEFDRVRKIYDRFLESFEEDESIWCDYAELESGLNDLERARALYDLALESLSQPKRVWDSYRDFEVEQMEYDTARQLFKRQLQVQDTTTVWIRRALFELTIPTSEQIKEYNDKVISTGDDELEFEFDVTQEALKNTRTVFEDALKHFKESPESRIVIFEAFRSFETSYGDVTTQAELEKRFPTVVKKTRTTDDGSVEEYYDYIFPDDNAVSNKFLEMAKKWSKGK